MICAEPVYRPLGDCMLEVESGYEANSELNFKLLALERPARDAAIAAVVETVPSFRQLVLVLDRRHTTHPGTQAALEQLIANLDDVTSLPSRRLVLPCSYDDPWSKEVTERYGVENNLEIIARANGLSNEGVIERGRGLRSPA